MTDTAEATDALSTSAVSAATGYSVQQIRDLEALGVIAPAHRADNGYRQFTVVHVRDLHAYRDLAHAVGPVDARRVMNRVRSLPTDEAAALVCSFHTRLNSEREQALAAQAALRAIHTEAATEAPPVDEDAMTITELAGALGVRTSTLRYWEEVGLVSAERAGTKAGSARRYPLQAIREARITAALRNAGYRIPEVQKSITAVRNLRDVGHSLDALDARVYAIGRRALALLRAGAILSEIIAADRSGADRSGGGRPGSMSPPTS